MQERWEASISIIIYISSQLILTQSIILVSSRSDNNGGLATNVWADLLKRHDPSLPRLLQESEAEEGVSRKKSFSP